MRVEVLAREEIEEKMLMTPGDIVMMLNEMGGMRVQATSPSLGAASVRIQGMRGRYTRFLSDGLPLFGEVGGLGLLQIPPMDLGQVEVIKGVASALYGAGAMGGVVNLISRRPGGTGTRVPAQSLDARRDRAVGVPGSAALARLGHLAARRRALAGDRRTSTTMPGRIFPATRAASSVRGCSGTEATAARSSPRPASRTRTATAARPTGEFCLPPARRTWKRSKPVDTTPARSASSCSRSATWSRPAPRSRGRATTISSARCSSAIATTRRSANGRPWRGRPADLGRRHRHRARRLHAARRAAVRLRLHRSRRFRAGRLHARAGCVALGERPSGRSQRVRHVLQSADFGCSRAPGDGPAGCRSAPASSPRRR